MVILGEYITPVFITDAFLAALSGCQKEGPAEKAGREADKAVERVSGSRSKRPEKASRMQRRAKKDNRQAVKRPLPDRADPRPVP